MQVLNVQFSLLNIPSCSLSSLAAQKLRRSCVKKKRKRIKKIGYAKLKEW